MKSRVHINLSVSDIERSTEFYSLLFGEQPTKIREDYANFRLDRPGLHLALVKSPEYANSDSLARHYGIELFDNVQLNDWRGRLEKAGVQLKIEEQVTCCYAVGNKFWARDPDGNDWEFWVRSAEAEAMNENSDAACCTPEHAAKPAAVAETKAESACCTPAQKSEAQATNQGCC